MNFIKQKSERFVSNKMKYLFLIFKNNIVNF